MLPLSDMWQELKLHEVVRQAQSILSLEAEDADVRQCLLLRGVRPLNHGHH